MSLQKNFTIGLMLFALFLGAGNIIFPPLLGQLAGQELILSMFGFLITGVGLPLLAVLSIAYAGDGLQTIAGRVHPAFGIIFTMIVYMAIGPFFGIPRTATVSFEIGIIPFLPASLADTSLFKAHLPLALFSIIFFIVTIIMALNPDKLVDRIGKILTPVLVLVIGALAVKSFIHPMGSIGEPQGVFTEIPFFRSFVEGYLTMDVIAALVFGIVIIQVLRTEGVTERKPMLKAMTIAGLIAAAGLIFVYISLGYIGATSVDAIGFQDNGGAVLALASAVLYGKYGSLILAITIIFACLTTSIGLVSACAVFFAETFPRFTYKNYVFVFAIFSAVFANVGLTQLISISLPVLLMIYPLAIVLMLLSFVDRFFDRAPVVYVLALIGTAMVSIFDGLKGADITFKPVEAIYSYLPFYNQSIGWLVPAAAGLIIGVIISKSSKRKTI